MRGRTEGGSQATHCPELRIQQDKIYGEAQWERNSPSKFKRLQMCAWPTATAHIWASKLPQHASSSILPPSLSPPCLIFITLPSALPWKSNLGEHMAGVNYYSPASQAARSPAAAVPQRSVYHGRPEKAIILAAGRRDFGGGKVWGISEGRTAASK